MRTSYPVVGTQAYGGSSCFSRRRFRRRCLRAARRAGRRAGRSAAGAACMPAAFRTPRGQARVRARDGDRRGHAPLRRAAQRRRPAHDRARHRRAARRGRSPQPASRHRAEERRRTGAALLRGAPGVSDDVAFAEVAELQRLLGAKKISSVELTDLYLKRLETYGPVYNAVVTILHDRARREAKRADRERARGRVRGPLHGIPYGVKDLLATPDAPTTWGAQPYRRQRFDFDATAVKKLSDAGAVLLVELAGGFGYGDADASFTGPGRTPWNAHYWSGGSSSGSGIAAAAGLVGFAIGSETSGSILFPSTACGVTGLRPTYGRVSRHGAMALCWSLDKLGPLARSARDAETVLRAIAGADANDPTAVDAPLVAPRRRPRIAVLKNATKGAMPEVAANFRASLKILAEFADVDGDVALPSGPWEPAVDVIVNA